MAFDYDKFAKTAERLIKSSGRPVSFIRKSNSEIPIDPEKPWNGNIQDIQTLDLYATFVPPNTVRQFGLSALGEGSMFYDLISVSEQMAIVYPGENDLRRYQIINDGSTEWNVIGVQLLKPGNTQVLAFVGTRR